MVKNDTTLRGAGLDRRGFLKVAGAGLAASALPTLPASVAE